MQSLDKRGLVTPLYSLEQVFSSGKCGGYVADLQTEYWVGVRPGALCDLVGTVANASVVTVGILILAVSLTYLYNFETEIQV